MVFFPDSHWVLYWVRVAFWFRKAIPAHWGSVSHWLPETWRRVRVGCLSINSTQRLLEFLPSCISVVQGCDTLPSFRLLKEQKVLLVPLNRWESAKVTCFQGIQAIKRIRHEILGWFRMLEVKSRNSVRLTQRGYFLSSLDVSQGYVRFFFAPYPPTVDSAISMFLFSMFQKQSWLLDVYLSDSWSQAIVKLEMRKYFSLIRHERKNQEMKNHYQPLAVIFFCKIIK